jgi:hypothetical protein
VYLPHEPVKIAACTYEDVALQTQRSARHLVWRALDNAYTQGTHVVEDRAAGTQADTVRQFSKRGRPVQADPNGYLVLAERK